METNFGKDKWEDWSNCWMSLFPQRSVEWHLLHIGRITGRSSSVAAGNIRYTEDDLPENLALQIIGLRSSKDLQPEERKRMDAGNRAEPILRNWYSQVRKVDVKEVGLAIWKKDQLIGASADGIVSTDGIVEFKYKGQIPSTLIFQAKTHDGKVSKSVAHIPTRDYDQMQHTMGVLGSQYCDYVILSPKVGIYTERIVFNEAYFNLLLSRYQQFKEKYLLPAIAEHGIEVILPPSEK